MRVSKKNVPAWMLAKPKIPFQEQIVRMLTKPNKQAKKMFSRYEGEIEKVMTDSSRLYTSSRIFDKWVEGDVNGR